MAALLAEARGVESDFIEKLVSKVTSFEYLAKIRAPITQVEPDSIPSHYAKLNEYSPQSLIAHFEKTAAFLDVFKPDITIQPNRSRRPGFITMRIALTERNTVARIEAALPALYKELSVGNLAPLPSKGRKAPSGEAQELTRLFGMTSSVRFPEGRGPYAYETRDGASYTVSFPTPYARDKGDVKCDTLMRKLSEGLGLNLVRSIGRSNGGYTQGTLGF